MSDDDTYCGICGSIAPLHYRMDMGVEVCRDCDPYDPPDVQLEEQQ